MHKSSIRIQHAEAIDLGIGIYINMTNSLYLKVSTDNCMTFTIFQCIEHVAPKGTVHFNLQHSCFPHVSRAREICVISYPSKFRTVCSGAAKTYRQKRAGPLCYGRSVGRPDKVSILQVVCCEPDVRTAVIVLLLRLLSRSAQAVLDRATHAIGLHVTTQ